MGRGASAGVFMVMDENARLAAGPLGPELLGRLFDQHAAGLVLYARQWCDDPEDAVQEAWIRLAAEPDAPPDAVAWLYRVVRHRAINVSRSARRRRHYETQATAADAFTASPGDALDTKAAAAALAGLDETQREVVVAHVWGGLTFQQIGHLTGTSDSTAQRRYVSALTALREKLGTPCLKNDSTTT